jgi:hypothetical protein
LHKEESRARVVRQVRYAQTVFNHGPYVKIFGYGLADQCRRCWLQCLSCRPPLRARTKIDSAPVTGASFAEVGRSPNATCNCQISAIEGASHRAPQFRHDHIPASCVRPVFQREFQTCGGISRPPDFLALKIEAMGSHDYMGQNLIAFSHLVQDAPTFYRLR